MYVTDYTSSRLFSNTQKMIDDNESNRIIREVFGRVGYAGNVLITPFASSIDLAFGSIAGFFSLLPAGYFKQLNHYAFDAIQKGGEGLPMTFASLLRTINPHAEMTTLVDAYDEHEVEELNGILSEKTSAFFRDLSDNAKAFENPIARHVATRLVATASLLSTVVTRIIDFVIGIFAALAALITAGKWERCNQFAYNCLRITALVNDVYLGLMLIANPWAFDTPPQKSVPTEYAEDLTSS